MKDAFPDKLVFLADFKTADGGGKGKLEASKAFLWLALIYVTIIGKLLGDSTHSRAV